MTPPLEGRARRLVDNVNTDYIISSARKRETIDERLLAPWLLESLDPAFAASVQDGDLIVAGRNFGCGSAMEVAVTVILAAGIKAVIAESFARSFYRNAINNGLLPAQCDTRGIEEGDRLTVALGETSLLVTDHTRGLVRQGPPIAGIARDILTCGGLVAYARRHEVRPPGEGGDKGNQNRGRGRNED